MIEQLSDESRSIIFMKNIRGFLKRLFFSFGEKNSDLLWLQVSLMVVLNWVKK